MSKWISIKRKLPPDGVMKLMCNMNCKELRNVMFVSWFAGGKEVFQRTDREVTHWMDLPQYPKDEQS